MSDENLMNLSVGGKECQITPLEGPFAPGLTPGYTKLPASDALVGQISTLFQQLTPLMSADMSKQTYYIVKWPDGLPHELAAFKDGSGLMGMSRKGGQIEKYAHFYEVNPNGNLMIGYGFSAMAVVTSQYYLDEINQKMTMISRSIDKILEFLYGDKKAELLSEISFVKYAYQNFASIMAFENQRTATIQSLQEARKTAIKDIEFYLEDLYSTTHEKDIGDIEGTVNKAYQIKQCLELAIQLYMTGNLLEVYYSQNYDPAYLKYVESDVGHYISKCEKQMLECFTTLRTAVQGHKKLKLGKKATVVPLLKEMDEIIEVLQKTEENALKRNLRKGLYSAENASEFCVSTDGTMYLKTV